VALGVPALFLYNACGVTLDSLAMLDAKLRMQASLLVLKVGVVLILLPQGLVAVIWGVALVEYLRALAGMVLVCRVLPVNRRALVQALLAMSAAALVVGGFVLAARELANLMQASLAGGLLLQGVALATAAAGCAWVALLSSRRWAALDRMDTLRGWRDRWIRGGRKNGEPA
ncbi:MAG: hypothetical protein ACKO5J_16760, partial [Rubrivivax sp.]